MLLVPDKACWQIFLYCLARAAQKYGVRIHAAVMMGNHYHLVLTDVQGQLPLFMQWFNRQLARCLQIHRGIDHEVWEPNRKYSAVELMTEKAIWDAVLYVLTNPIKAALVSRLSEYRRGVIGPPQLQEGSLTAERPSVLFKDSAPASVTLPLSAPEVTGQDAAAFAQDLEALLPEASRQARQGVRRFLGWKGVLRTSPRSRPTSKPSRFGLSPALKALTAHALRQAIEELRAFRSAYREAYEAFRDGAHDMLFPEGTWWMVRFSGAACAG